MAFVTRTSVVFTCPTCGTEADIGTSPAYGSIARCRNATCGGQEAFTGFPHILTSPQQPESKPNWLTGLMGRIAAPYFNLLAGVVLNLIVLALVGIVTYYVVRASLDKEVPRIIQEEMRRQSVPTK